MSLQLGDTIADGARRAFTKTGGVLMALLFAFMIVFMGAMNTVIVELVPAEFQDSQQFGLVFPVSPAVAGGIAAVGMLFGVVFYLVTTRALTREHAELSSLPAELFTRRIGRATLSAIGATILIQLAVTVGFFLLFVPGIFLTVSFMFAVFAIGVEDRRAIDSMRRSWQLASGNRWRLLALLVIVGVFVALLTTIGSVFGVLDPLVGDVVSLAIISVLSIVSYGVVAEAYVRLRDDDGGEKGGTESPDPAEAAV